MSSWVFGMAQFAAAAADLHSGTLSSHESQYVFYPLTTPHPPPSSPQGVPLWIALFSGKHPKLPIANYVFAEITSSCKYGPSRCQEKYGNSLIELKILQRSF